LDPTLVSRCQAGDQEAFALLFDQYKHLVYRTAVLTLANSGDAEDVMQEVFVQVHRSLGKYDPARGAFTTWLYRITVNRALNWRRRRDTFLSLEGIPERAQVGAPDAESRLDDSAMIQKALSHLTPKLRVAIVLRYYWELSYAEISEILELPLGTVKSRLNAALHALHCALKEEPFGVANRRTNNELS
jgi:RNA polymerase sigma-70 factor (ECF subfamily)